MDGETGGAEQPQTAEFEFVGGPVKMSARVKVTPRGLWAIGGLVTGVLLSTAAIVWVSTSVARRHPVATRFRVR